MLQERRMFVYTLRGGDLDLDPSLLWIGIRVSSCSHTRGYMLQIPVWGLHTSESPLPGIVYSRGLRPVINILQLSLPQSIYTQASFVQGLYTLDFRFQGLYAMNFFGWGDYILIFQGQYTGTW